MESITNINDVKTTKFRQQADEAFEAARAEMSVDKATAYWLDYIVAGIVLTKHQPQRVSDIRGEVDKLSNFPDPYAEATTATRLSWIRLTAESLASRGIFDKARVPYGDGRATAYQKSSGQPAPAPAPKAEAPAEPSRKRARKNVNKPTAAETKPKAKKPARKDYAVVMLAGQLKAVTRGSKAYKQVKGTDDVIADKLTKDEANRQING